MARDREVSRATGAAALLLTLALTPSACGGNATEPAQSPSEAASATAASSTSPGPAHAGHAEPGHHGHHAGGGGHPGHHSTTANHRFEDPERWAKVFDDPERDEWQKPDAVLDFLKLPENALVADLGAGTGYFSVRLAKRVPKGKVFAVDIEDKLLKHLASRAEKAKLGNVITVLAAQDDPKLPPNLDLVLVVDTYHHISERVPYFEGVAKKLSAKGRVVIVDFKLGDLPVGPPDKHKISQDQTHTEMEAAGFQLCDELKTLPYQYVLSFGPHC
ncbi:MAG: methyltransferase domain-containing protein [Polyangiaceae bacterium]|nr:methyltransferase domain-containing protein [Polyangiaceae bacterium]